MNNPGENLREELMESRTRSFSGLWGFADDYGIVDGKIKPIIDGELSNIPYSTKEYFPMGRPELPGEFAKLANGSDEDVLEFVRRYGLLSGNIPYPAFKKDETAWTEKVMRGNPLAWVKSHAKAVKLVMDLSDALDKPDNLKTKIQELTVTLPGNDKPLILFNIAVKNVYDLSHTGSCYELEPKTAALYIITSILNKNIFGISRHLQVENQRIVSLFSTHDLLDCIYWMLADAAVSGRIKTCERCGAPFIADHEKRRYCPPLPHEDVSHCMKLAKAKRHRDKNKTEA